MHRHARLCLASSLYRLVDVVSPHALAAIFGQQGWVDVEC